MINRNAATTLRQAREAYDMVEHLTLIKNQAKLPAADIGGIWAADKFDRLTQLLAAYYERTCLMFWANRPIDRALIPQAIDLAEVLGLHLSGQSRDLQLNNRTFLARLEAAN